MHGIPKNTRGLPSNILYVIAGGSSTIIRSKIWHCSQLSYISMALVPMQQKQGLYLSQYYY